MELTSTAPTALPKHESDEEAIPFLRFVFTVDATDLAIVPNFIVPLARLSSQILLRLFGLLLNHREREEIEVSH